MKKEPKKKKASWDLGKEQNTALPLF
uniref:Uncharacterized protein n=1 Tax=Rhizophora mucronata TaxID=61149 RepID=A0A2P2NTF8_RHIMU